MTQLTNLTKTQLVAMVKSIQNDNEQIRDEMSQLIGRTSHVNANVSHRLYIVEELLQEIEKVLFELQNPPKTSIWQRFAGL